MTMNREALLGEFQALLRAGKRAAAFELIEPELASGDLRFILAYATAKVQDGEALTAVNLLRQYEQHFNNSHYVLLAAVAARLLISQIEPWTERAESQLLKIIQESPPEEPVLHQFQHYLALCSACGIRVQSDIRAALTRFDPRLSSAAGNSVKATFLGFPKSASSTMERRVPLPKAPLFFESDATGCGPRLAEPANVDVGDQEFPVFKDVRLYMLPNMYGLIEVEPGVFLGDVVGGCNPYTQGIVTRIGEQYYKNLDHPLFKEHQEQAISGRRLVPFRLAGTYYFHFLVETLQNIFEVPNDFRQVPIVLPRGEGFFERIPQRVHDNAAAAICAADQRYEFLDDGIYGLDEVVVPKRIKYARASYQNQLLSALGIPRHSIQPSNRSRILYLGRRSAAVGAVSNEEDLVARLFARFPTFRRIYLEDMSLSQQIVAFRGAGLIIAPHGDGLNNILFCHPGTGVIEIHQPESNTRYWHVSAMQGLRYLAYVPSSYDSTTSTYVIQPDRLIDAIDEIAGMAPVQLDELSPA
jgi:hypothetical protein